jgi:predicted GNAT family acetyltransferase
MLPPGRSILYATPHRLQPPDNWKVLVAIEGLQFLHDGKSLEGNSAFHPVALTQPDVPQMIELASLTKPGPFAKRTIEFSHYYGVFEDNRLVAMTGQRMHIQNYTEVSAVCTHPQYLGKGYASALVRHQVNLIISHQQIPFLHVRADNRRAIELYERLGFHRQGPMNFYLLRKQ